MSSLPKPLGQPWLDNWLVPIRDFPISDGYWVKDPSINV